MEQGSVSDPVSFMDNLHDRGMKVTLNVHPALGIRECESMYKEMAEAMGMDRQPENRLNSILQIRVSGKLF